MQCSKIGSGVTGPEVINSKYRIDVITTPGFNFSKWVFGWGSTRILLKFYQFLTSNRDFNWGSIKICGGRGSILEQSSNTLDTVVFHSDILNHF